MTEETTPPSSRHGLGSPPPLLGEPWGGAHAVPADNRSVRRQCSATSVMSRMTCSMNCPVPSSRAPAGAAVPRTRAPRRAISASSRFIWALAIHARIQTSSSTL
jgi:hypothetical protein